MLIFLYKLVPDVNVFKTEDVTCRAVTTIEADEAAASSDFLKKIKKKF